MNSNEVTIRRMSENDIEEWLRLRKLLWDETSDAEHKAEIVAIIEHPDTQAVIVAEAINGHLVGFLEASIRSWVEDCETDHVGYLEGWFVESGYRRRGIGTDMVSAAEAWARKKGCIEMASDAEIGNDASIEAHKTLGFEETSRLVHLRKELD